jgi:acyl carrier protein
MGDDMGTNGTTETVVQILTDMTGDWDLGLQGGIDRDTKLMHDLAFESIDIVELVVAIEEKFGTRKIPFEKLLMVDGRYVDDLSVGQIAEFVADHLSPRTELVERAHSQ